MLLTEPQLRTLTLAQAIERTDTERALVSQADLDTATRTAISAARLRGVQRVEVGDIALDRATAIVARASGADTTVAGLGRPNRPGHQLGQTVNCCSCFVRPFQKLFGNNVSRKLLVPIKYRNCNFFSVSY